MDSGGTVPPSEVGAAIRSALAQEDWDEVMSLIERNWSVLLAQEMPLLTEVLGSAPEHIRHGQPRWAIAAGYLGLLAQGSASPTLYRDVVSRPRAGRTLLDMLSELTSRSAGRRAVGDFSEAVDAARRAQGLLAAAADEQRVQLKYALPHLLLQLARSFELAGNERPALVTYAEVYDLGRVIDDDHLASQAAGRIAWIHAVAGRRSLAERWLLRTETRHPMPDRLRTGEYLSRALLAVDVLNFEASRTLLEKVLSDVDSESWAEILLVRAVLARPEDGDQLVQAVEEAAVVLPAGLVSSGANADCLAIVIVIARERQSQQVRGALDLRRYEIGPSTAVTTLAHAYADASQGDRSASIKKARFAMRSSSGHPRWSIAASLLLHVLGDVSDTELRSTVATAIEKGQLRALNIIPAPELSALGLPHQVLKSLLMVPISQGLNPTLALSKRERQVFQHLSLGVSTDEIATFLYISPNTVKTHLKSIYRKLGIQRRDQAILLARELGLELVKNEGTEYSASDTRVT